MDDSGKALGVFFCYAPADQAWCDPLVTQLRDRENAGKLELWHRGKIPFGGDEEAWIERRIREARVAVFLISPEFLNADKIRDQQVPRLLDRRASEGVHFVPVIIRPCLWKEALWLSPLKTWQDGRPLDRQDDERYAALAHHVFDLVCGPPPKARPQDVPPYRGLKPFGVGDAGLFFGRSKLVAELLESVRGLCETRCDQRTVAIIGPSGSGKSSLARAGLLAHLAAGGEIAGSEIAGSERWPIVDLEIGQDPLERLALKLIELEGVAPTTPELQKWMGCLAAQPETLSNSATVALRHAPDRRLVVLVDQSEKLFASTVTSDRRAAFLANLHHAATVVGGRTVVVLVLRADFFGDFMSVSPEAKKLLDRQVLVHPMTEAELREAIEKPILRCGGEIEDGVVDLLLKDVERQKDALPLLQHTLLELWRLDRSRLTVENYRAIGGVARAIQASADQKFSELDEGEKSACKEIFLQLAQSTGTGRLRYTLRTVGHQELAEAAGGDEIVETVLAKFIDARLLTSKGDEDERYVEVAHESLAEHWQAFHDWLEDDREYLEERRRLEESATEWNQNDGDASVLYRGEKLTRALRFAERPLPRSAREFLEESRKKKLRDRLWLGAAAVLAAALIAGLGFLVLRGLGRVGAEELVARAEKLVDNQPVRALALSLRAIHVAEKSGRLLFPEAELVLRKALARGEPLGETGEHVLDVVVQDQQILMATRTETGGDVLRIRKIALPSGARPFEWRGEESDSFRPSGQQIASAEFSSDGKQVLVRAGTGGRIFRLDLVNTDSQAQLLTQAQVGELERESRIVDPRCRQACAEWIRNVAARTAAGGDWCVAWRGKQARLWDLRSPVPPADPAPLSRDPFADGSGKLEELELPWKIDAVEQLAVGQDGQWSAAWISDEDPEEDGSVYVWHGSAGGRRKLRHHSGTKVFLVFAGNPSDVRWLATGSDEDGLRLWDLEEIGRDSGTPPVPTFSMGSSTELIVTGSGTEGRPARWLLYVGQPGGAHLMDFERVDEWDAGRGWLLLPHLGTVTSAAFSADEDLLATGDEEGGVFLWNLSRDAAEIAASRVLLGRLEPGVRKLTFVSRERRELVSLDNEGAVRQWNLDSEPLKKAACTVVRRHLDREEWREACPERSR